MFRNNIFLIVFQLQQSYNPTNEQLLKRISKTVEIDGSRIMIR